MNRFTRYAAGSALMAPVLAFAQGDPVTAGMTEVATKVATYGAGLVGIALVGIGFFVGIKFLKKAVRAA